MTDNVIRVVTFSDTEARITNVCDYPVTNDKRWMVKVIRMVQEDAVMAAQNGERITVNCVARGDNVLPIH